MQWLTTIKTVLELIPLIITLLKAVEVAIPESGKGAEKLAMVRGVVEASYTSAKDATVAFEQIWPILDNAIKVIVSAFNNTGVFKKNDV